MLIQHRVFKDTSTVDAHFEKKCITEMDDFPVSNIEDLLYLRDNIKTEHSHVEYNAFLLPC
jgi:hypothetical protein